MERIRRRRIHAAAHPGRAGRDRPSSRRAPRGSIGRRGLGSGARPGKERALRLPVGAGVWPLSDPARPGDREGRAATQPGTAARADAVRERAQERESNEERTRTTSGAHAPSPPNTTGCAGVPGRVAARPCPALPDPSGLTTRRGPSPVCGVLTRGPRRVGNPRVERAGLPRSPERLREQTLCSIELKSGSPARSARTTSGARASSPRNTTGYAGVPGRVAAQSCLSPA